MTYHVEVTPEIPQSTHHVSLTDGEKTVGLIICDSKGAADPFNISMAPNQRSSLRTKSGATKYEDLEEPWSATAQDDWSGGRAQEDHEDDTTKFFDSRRCQTAFKQIYNAPMEYYATGLKDAVTNYPGSVTWKRMKPNTAYAIRLELTESMDAGQIYILLRRRGTPVMPLVVTLRADDDDLPGEILEEHEYTTEEITDVLSEWRKFVFDQGTLTAGTCWIMVHTEEETGTGFWQVGMKPVTDSSTLYYRKETWQDSTDFDLYYRMTAADSGRKARFFTYNQLTFAMTQTATGDPRLYVNGHMGVVGNDVAAGSVTMENEGWSFTPNEWQGWRIGIIRGAGIEDSETVWRTIVSNTATSITVDEPWTIALNPNTGYIITDGDRFFEIPPEVHGLTAYVTDIVVTNNIIYFAQGDHTPIRKMTWNWIGEQWSSIADEYYHYIIPGVQPEGEEVEEGEGGEEEGEEGGSGGSDGPLFSAPLRSGSDPRELKLIQNCATYLQVVRDTTGLVLWRAQNDDENHQISISQTAVTDWFGFVLADLQAGSGGSIIPTGETELYTDGVDYLYPDNVSLMYKFTCGEITGSGGPKFQVYIQASEDNIVYEDVKSVQLETSQEEIYLACSIKRRYRRLHIVITGGTSSKMASLRVENVAHSKFVTPMTFNDSYGKITGLIEYPQMMNSQYKTLWVFREGMVHSISGENVVDKINLEELCTVMEEWNGHASLVHNNYLYFRWMRGGIQRYYNQQVDSVGPDKDTGLPEDRQGQIADMLAYPGRYFAAIDAGEEYSSVLLNNNSGWHEIYRAPNPGERIRALGYQAVSGTRPDRLWISVGDDIVWLVMPSNTLKTYYDPESEYTHESVLVSSWYTIGMVDVIKQWGSMNVMAENMGDECCIEADYQIDQDPTWYPMTAVYDESPTEEIKFADNFGISAKRLRYRLRLQTSDRKKSPFVKAVVLKTVIKVPTKYNLGMSCRNVMDDVNLCGEVEDITPWERLGTLMEWADNATALRMRCFTYPFDDRIVFLDPPQVSNLREKNCPGMLMTISLNEI